jgi:plasmid stabilization system protein ParE
LLKEENESVEIKWSRAALNQLAEILDFIIGNNFDPYANELEDKIISKLDRLIENASLYPIDRYKKNNDGSWRAFEVDDYRVSYKVQKSTIRVIRIRHTSRRPRNY